MSYPLTFVSRGLSVNNNVTLTFEAGAVLKFSSYDGLSIYGTLLAQGTADDAESTSLQFTMTV